MVSLFLHTPFPSPEIWRVLPHRKQLLHGMLCSHVVGFHLFEYARHFMTSCRRLLGLGENVGAGPGGGGELNFPSMPLRVWFALCFVCAHCVSVHGVCWEEALDANGVDTRLAPPHVTLTPPLPRLASAID